MYDRQTVLNMWFDCVKNVSRVQEQMAVHELELIVPFAEALCKKKDNRHATVSYYRKHLRLKTFDKSNQQNDLFPHREGELVEIHLIDGNRNGNSLDQYLVSCGNLVSATFEEAELIPESEYRRLNEIAWRDERDRDEYKRLRLKLIGLLYEAKSRERVEDVFSRYGIDDRVERVQLLRKCMNVIGVHNLGDELSPEDEYSDELEVFMSGAWRQMA